MSKQIILCYECNEQSRTDEVYFKCTIDRFYKKSEKIKETPIYMGSKSKYNNKKIEKKIANNKKQFKGDTYVIYFIDIDRVAANPEDKKTLEEIKNYCWSNSYDLVLFSKDIEDVYWGAPVPDDEKVKKAAEFRRKQMIDSVNEKQLSSMTIARHRSNILIVLDAYWTRK